MFKWLFKVLSHKHVSVSYQQDGIHYNFSKCHEEKLFNPQVYDPKNPYEDEIY